MGFSTATKRWRFITTLAYHYIKHFLLVTQIHSPQSVIAVGKTGELAVAFLRDWLSQSRVVAVLPSLFLMAYVIERFFLREQVTFLL